MNFVRTLEPAYEVPSRKHVMNKLRELYAETREKVEVKLKEVTSAAITLDFWTSRATNSYLGVTVHFISPRWTMESYALQTREVKERHRADNVAEGIQHVVVEWELSEKLSGMTTDNALKYCRSCRAVAVSSFTMCCSFVTASC